MIAQVNGIQLYFDIENAGLAPLGNKMVEKPPCFILHGGPGFDHSMFKPLFSPLAEFMQLIYVDHRGNGRSSRLLSEEYTLAKTVEDLEGLREYLDLNKIILLGASYGGMVALSYATRYPENVSNAILITTAPSYEWFEEARNEAYKRASKSIKPELDLLFGARIASPEQMRRSFSLLIPLFFQHDFQYFRETIEEKLDRTIFSPEAINWAFGFEIKQNYDVRDKLKLITAPTLIIAGRRDWVMLPHQQEFMHKNIPNSRLEMFEDGGHMILMETTGRLLKIIKDFINIYY